jgi:hypothetical protein
LSKYGPFSYRQPSVDYNVKEPVGSFKTRAAKGSFSIRAPTQKFSRFSGRVSNYSPVLGNRIKDARISNFAPKLAFKTPKVNMDGGRAYTSGPQNRDTDAVAGTYFRDPKIGLYAPRTASRVHDPVGRFAVRAPQDYNRVAGPTDHTVHSAPKQYISPSKW